jgi:hypothetical protein
VDLLVTAGLFLLATFVLTFGSYFVARRFLVRRSNDESRELASSVIFRVAALHGLIIALVFAEELGNSHELVHTVNREANQLESIYYDLGHHGTSKVGEIREALAFYTYDVIEHEWDRLNDSGQLSDDAWTYREIVVRELLQIEADTPAQEFLRQRMLNQITAVEDERNNREIIAATDVSILFWIIAFAGIALVAAPYFPFSPTTANLTILGLYALYTGVVLFFIYAFDNPFAGFSGTPPVSLEILYDGTFRSLVEASVNSPYGGAP